jgi:hypothetical protein
VRRGLSAPLTAAVAVAFADSSIVVLALPELYGRFDTTIEGVSWVVTAYNAAVAVAALALLLLVHRLSAALLLGAGLGALPRRRDCVRGSAEPRVSDRSANRPGSGRGAAARRGAAATRARSLDCGGTFGLALGPALGVC